MFLAQAIKLPINGLPAPNPGSHTAALPLALHAFMFYTLQVILMLCLLGLTSANVVPIPYFAPGGVIPFGFPAYQPVAYSAVYTPAVHPGYVAKTPGAEHYAPLPEGLGYASHHINVNKAPGTE